MTKEDLYKACKKYANDYVKKEMVMPASDKITDKWDKADFLRFKTQSSKVVSQVEYDIKGIAGKVTDAVFEELILSVGGERA